MTIQDGLDEIKLRQELQKASGAEICRLRFTFDEISKSVGKMVEMIYARDKQIAALRMRNRPTN